MEKAAREKERYGKWWDAGIHDASIELWNYRTEGPEGRYGHLRAAIDRIWNDTVKETFIWNDWTEVMIRAFIENRWTTVTGPGASWKTTSAAIYALTSWYSSPRDTVVICTSTTLDGLRRRIWKEISKF